MTDSIPNPETTGTTFDVFAINIKSGARRQMATGLTEPNAEAYVTMAVMRRGVDKEFFIVLPGWQPISAAPCDDTLAWIRWAAGEEHIVDFDRDPEWWAERGATHWRPATDEEREVHSGRIATGRGPLGVAGAVE